ncbi:hypothetical protein LXL04_006629 [Taraxacum kok-saghyz]
MKMLIQPISIEDNRPDRWIFKGAPKRTLSSAWIRGRLELCRSMGKVFKNEWLKWIPIKDNIFVWRIFKGRIAVRKNLMDMDIDVPNSKCEICNVQVDDISHLFFKCDLASWLWTSLGLWVNCSIPMFENITDCFDWIDRDFQVPVRVKIVKVLVAALFKSIWIHRNDIISNNKRVEKEFCLRRLVHQCMKMKNMEEQQSEVRVLEEEKMTGYCIKPVVNRV